MRDGTTAPGPSEAKGPRGWRTRKDPFEGVWTDEVVPLLEVDKEEVLDATTILATLRGRHGEAYGAGQLRTLQRRVRDWRALHGPGREVMFEQVHEAGREGAFDFTDCGELGVTIAGEKLEHLLFQLVLSFSKWRFVCLAFAETFEAMVHGLQSGLWKLGGVPRILSTKRIAFGSTMKAASPISSKSVCASSATLWVFMAFPWLPS